MEDAAGQELDLQYYEGQTLGGLYHGEGTLYSVGSGRNKKKVYMGQFKQGLKDGTGKEFGPNGKNVVYEGHFKQGKR